jgi:hypothetical protein
MTSIPADKPLLDILGDAWEVASRRPRLVAAAILIPTMFLGLLDSQLDPDDALRFGGLFGLVMLYLQLLLTSAALREFGMLPARYDPRRPTLGRYPAAFGLSLLYALCVLAGLVALVIPGLVLIVRWAVSLPALVAEDEGIVDSLKRSWSLTRGEAPLIIQVYVLFLLSMGLFAASMVFSYPYYGPAPILSAILTNLLFAVGHVGLWLAAAALYRRLRLKELAEPAM